MSAANFFADAIRSYNASSARSAIYAFIKQTSRSSGSCPRSSGLTVLLLLTLLSQPLLADVNAMLKRNTVYEGDVVTLIIETSDRRHGGEPDLAVLQQDFEVIGSSNSQQVQIINGRRTDKRQWHIELVPKHSGEITVPAISVGSDKTAPLPLSVKSQPAPVAAGTGQPVFLKAHIEPANGTAYVQQQIQYILQLYYREAVAEGSFEGPDVANALVEKLGDDSQFKTTVNGEPYQVLERRYAIFPEQSGQLVIPAVVFTGRMSDESVQRPRSANMRSMMDQFLGGSLQRTPGERVRLRSEAITLDILPRPVSYDGQHWLPSEQVVLHDSWAEGPPEFKVGEPVTRTITLEATGLESSHLPDIDLPETSGMRLYPEQPQHTTRTDGELVYGSSQQAVAYVPVTAGRITIPETRIDWWDTVEQRQRSTVLPAWQVNVLAGAAGSAEAQPPAPAEITAPAAVIEDPDATPAAEQPDSAWLRWVLITAVLCMALILLWYLQRHMRAGSEPQAVSGSTLSGKQALREAGHLLELACNNNDPQAAARALLQWAAAKWPDEAPRNLGGLAQWLQAGTEEIGELERVLYASGSSSWQGDALLKLYKKGLEKVVSDKHVTQQGLSPLYPDWKTR
jgi:hypothetical protein